MSKYLTQRAILLWKTLPVVTVVEAWYYIVSFVTLLVLVTPLIIVINIRPESTKEIVGVFDLNSEIGIRNSEEL